MLAILRADTLARIRATVPGTTEGFLGTFCGQLESSPERKAAHSLAGLKWGRSVAKSFESREFLQPLTDSHQSCARFCLKCGYFSGVGRWHLSRPPWPIH